MTALLQKLLEQRGDKWLPRDVSEDGKRHYMRAIADTNEFRRIRDLPRRTWGAEYVELLTEELRTSSGTMKLWPTQAAALAEIALFHGLLGPIGVGHGKTLISLLAPTVLEAKRPVLLVPAKLRDKTLKIDWPELRKHWKIHPYNLRVLSYSEISLEQNADVLFDIGPDLIICDEAHYLRNSRSGRTRRVARYLKVYPLTAFVALSGTVANRSFIDWAHLSDWALHEGTPLPRNWNELTEWSLLFDVTVPDEQRPLPGALRVFCEMGDTIHEGWRRRFVSTPGVIATEETEVQASLSIQKIKNIGMNDTLEGLTNLRTFWETPNGDEITSAAELWRHARELALGFYYRWDPPAPADWLDARRAWKRYVRETLKHNRRGLDTELQVWNESKRNPHEEWLNWEAIKKTFISQSVAQWEDMSALHFCVEWLNREDAGIVWVEHVAFGEILSQMSGCTYFGAGDNQIETTTEKRIIASIAAHGEGKNLQRWSRNLITVPPSNGKTWEQLLGRTHREGQLADEVTYDVLMHEPELEECFLKALEDAKYIEETYGTRQRLRYATILLSDNETKNETETGE